MHTIIEQHNLHSDRFVSSRVTYDTAHHWTMRADSPTHGLPRQLPNQRYLEPSHRQVVFQGCAHRGQGTGRATRPLRVPRCQSPNCTSRRRWCNCFSRVCSINGESRALMYRVLNCTEKKTLHASVVAAYNGIFVRAIDLGKSKK